MPDWMIMAGFTVLGASIAAYPFKGLRKKIIVLFGSIIFLVVGYTVWGNFFDWRAFQLAKVQQASTQKILETLGSTETMIERLQARLKKTPREAQAWFLLGRLYVVEGKWQEANQAYQKALAIAPKNMVYVLHFAKSVVEFNQRLDADTRLLLQDILVHDPSQPDALAILGFDAYQQHHFNQAIAYWEQLLALPSVSGEEAKQLRRAIVKARQELQNNT